jgi:two-component system, NarL family, nitrate/nitrite response regulator NarL
VTPSTSSIRIVIAGDHPIFREGLRRLLEKEDGFVIEGERAVGPSAVAFINQLDPDILLLGLVGSASRGVEMLQLVADSGSRVRTIVLTDKVEAPDVIRSLQLGVRGVVLTDSAPDVLVSCIRSVMIDQCWIGLEPVSGALPSLKRLETDRLRTRAFGLTRRELTILRDVVAGFTNREIAERASISENTVKSHLTHIFNKLGASNRVELALFAAHHRLLGGV